MEAALRDVQVAQVREQITQLRANGSRARYPEALKQQVAALRAAGIPAARLAAELKLAESQVYDWHRTYSQLSAQVFEVRPSATPAAAAPTGDAPISISIGSVVVTIAYRER